VSWSGSDFWEQADFWDQAGVARPVVERAGAGALRDDAGSDKGRQRRVMLNMVISL
jgi:hypothetical protein